MRRPDSTPGILTRAILLCVLAICCSPVRADVQSNFFAGTIPMDGDISSFFDVSGSPLPGVCVSNSPAPSIPGQPGTAGLAKSNGLGSQTGQYHPSGFNPRRLICAYNPSVNGGTIYVGVDLPGGSGTAANPDYLDPLTCGGAPPCPDSTSPPIQRGSVVPFDADGNGEAETIGRTGDAPLRNCSDVATNSVVDIFNCSYGGVMTDDPSDATNNFGVEEDYALKIEFTNGTTVGVNFYEDNTTPSGQAALNIAATNALSMFGVVASKSTAGVVPGIPLGYDVEFAVTNVNAAAGSCLQATITVASGTSREGISYGTDTEVLQYAYIVPVAPCITGIAQQGNDMLITWTTTGGKTNVVQATNGDLGGNYSNNFTDISPIIIPNGISLTTTNYLDVGGATNFPPRSYRVRLVP